LLSDSAPSACSEESDAANAGRRPELLAAARRSRVRLYAASFVVDAVAYGFKILVPVVAQEHFDAGPVMLGLLGTASMLVYAAVCLLSGRLSDRFGSRALYLGGLAVVLAVALPLALVASSLAILFVASALFDGGLGLFWPPLERELSFTSPREHLARTVGTFNCTWAAGICLGGIGGASFYARLGYTSGIALFAGLIAASLVILAARLARAPPSSSVAREELESESRDARRVAFFLRLGWVANFAAYFAMQGIAYLFPHLRAQIGFSIEKMGVFLLAITLPRFLAFVALRRLSSWHFSLAWIVVVQSLAGSALVVLSLLTHAEWAFLLLLPALGAFGGLSYSASFYYGLRVPSREGTNSGVHELFLSLGATAGPLACGLVASAAPEWPGAIFAFCGAVILAFLGVELAMARHHAQG